MAKKSRNICQSYGLTQEQMAMVLGLKRAQWSMHESNVRDIPVHAQTTLRKMNEYLNVGKMARHVPSKMTQDEIQEGISRWLGDNVFEQQGLIRRIDAENEQNLKTEKLRQVFDFVKHSGECNSKGKDVIQNLLELKVKTAYSPERALKRMKMEVKLEVLRFEEKLLREKLGNVTAVADEH